MPIALTTMWLVGPYTVHARPRLDSPYWLVYVVFRGERLIGKSFSRPDLGCCRWLEASKSGTCYATASTKPRRHSSGGDRQVRNGHPKP